MNQPAFKNAIFLMMVVIGVELASQGAAQGFSLSAGDDLLLATIGARPMGMGGAFSALSDDLNALNSNPAGLASLKQAEVGYDRFQSFSDIHYDYWAGALPVDKLGAIALGYMGVGTAPFNRNGNPDIAPVSTVETAFLAAWGQAWTSWLKTGLELKILSRKENGQDGMGAALDLGVLLRPAKRLSVALVGKNLGPTMTVQGSGAESLPAVGKLGVAVRVLNRGAHQLDWVGEESVNFLSHRPWYGTGAEYWYRGTLAARCGHVGNLEAKGLAAGAGVRVKGFQLDYAFQPYAQLGSTHRISGLYRFDTSRKPASRDFEAPTTAGAISAAPVKPKAPVAAAPVTLGKPTVIMSVVGQEVEISWDTPTGNVASYELVVAREGGTSKILSVTGKSILLKNLKSGSMYDVEIKAMSPSGERGPASDDLYFKAP